MRITVLLAIVFAFLGALGLGGLALMQSTVEIAFVKACVFLVTFGIIGWGIGHLLVFLWPEFRGRETIVEQVDHIDYVFPDEQNGGD